MAKRILMTGASGYVGRHLSRALPASEFEVMALVRREHRLEASPFGTIVADLTHDGWEGLLPREGVDALVHLAADHRSLEDTSGSIAAQIRLHVDATARLLDWAVGAGVRHVLYVSTSAVLCDADVDAPPRGEDFERVSPPDCHPYGLSRRLAEELVELYRGRIPCVTIVRPSLIYGPDQGDESTLVKLAEALMMGEQVPLLQPDGHLLTPVFVDDVVAVLVWLLRHSDVSNVTLNVGSGEHWTEGGLARSLAKHLREPLAFEVHHQASRSFAVSSAKLDALIPDRPKTAWDPALLS